MLSDAGIDVVIFDVTNQITYRKDYMALLRVWARERELGNRTPQVAFLTPFWALEKEPGILFKWERRYRRCRELRKSGFAPRPNTRGGQWD